MPPMEEEELKGLSETERQALLADDEDKDALEKIAGEASDDDGDDGDDDGADDDRAGNDNEPVKAKTGTKPAAQDDAQALADDDGEEDAPTVLPQLEAGDAEAAKAQIDTLKAKRKELRGKYSTGEIDDETFDAQLDAVESEMATAQRVIDAADMNVRIAEANRKAMEESWKSTVGKFFQKVAKEEGIDYGKDAALNAALDVIVRGLANEKGEDGALVHADKSSGWYLREAHRQVKQRFGMISVPKGATAQPAKSGGKAPDLSKVPPNISRAPAAAASKTGADDGGGEFAHLESLSGMALEKAVARLSPEQQARWAEEA